MLADVAFRVYRTQGRKMRYDHDIGGAFDGWSSRYDEWIPIYSPRIRPHLSYDEDKVTFNADFDEIHLPDQSG